MLTLSHRPHRFAELVGQEQARVVLQALVHADDLPAALLFSGASGTGKTSAARVLAAALNCPSQANGDCCGTCRSCTDTQTGRALTVHEVDAATHGGVEEIRALHELTQFATGGTWRVIVLDEAHAMSRVAFNALLKVLEEPPARTVFVLCTTEPDRIIATVRSRVMPIHFRAVAPSVIADRLATIARAETITTSAEVLSEIARLADGGLRDAVMLFDQARRVGASTAADVRALVGHTDQAPLIVTALTNGELAKARSHLGDFYTDSGDIPELLTDLIEDLQTRYANHALSHQRLVGATKLLWDGRTIPDSSPRTARSQMDALITLLSAVLGPTPSDPAPIPQVSEKSPKSPKSLPADDEVVELEDLVELLSSE
jgi:DNA polymerase-3 subunit gamma/tau